jgi:hypothetical protein
MDRYYYAGGKRVALELEPERIAVDPAKARGAGMADLARRVERDGTRLPGGRVVVGRATLGAADLLLLRESGGAQAVYRHGAVIAIPLSEVRIEMDPGQRQAVLDALEATDIETEIAEDTEERLVVRPRSGSGDDAMDLANFIYERARPAASAARMVQITRRPEPSRR